MSGNEDVHRCACIVAQSGDLVVTCGRYVRVHSAPEVPICARHRGFGGQGNPVVYFIAWGEYLKVGTTKLNPVARLKAVMTNGAIRPSDVSGVPILLASVPGDYATEAAFHAILADYRVEGEWFRREGPVEELVQWIDRKYGIEGATLPASDDYEPTRIAEFDGQSLEPSVDF